MGATAVPSDDGKGYVINGVKLWATNGVIADVVDRHGGRPEDGRAQGRHHRVHLPMDLDGIEVKHRNEFMGLRGIENSVTTFTDVFVPEENVLAGVGKGLKIALTTLNTGRLSLPAICVGATKYSLRIARQWSQRAQAVGPADRQARPDRAEARLPRRHGLRPRGDGRRVQPPRRRQAARLPHRGGDREALRLRAGLAGRRHDGPGPRRPRLRDGEVASRPRREAGPRRADAARHAHQPHLRGLHGDHAPDDRPRGGRPAPRGRRRHPARRRRRGREGQAGAKAGAFYAKWFPSLADGQGPEPELLRRVRRRWPSTCATPSATAASSRARRSTRWAATRPSSSRRAPCWAASSTSAPSSTRSPARAPTRETIAERGPVPRRTAPTSSPTCSAARPAAAPTRLFHELWANDDDAQYATAQKVLSGRYEWFEGDVLDPAGDGPMIPDEAMPTPAKEKLSV